MDEEGSSSWIGRAKFSQTVYHRFNSSSNLASTPFSIQPREISRLSLRKSLEAPFPSKKLAPTNPQIQPNTLINKQRSVSPLPQTASAKSAVCSLSSSRSLETPFSFQKLAPANPQIEYNPLTNRQRSVSPLPQTLVPDTFKEAQAQSKNKRSLTPHARRKEPHKGIVRRLLHRDLREADKLGSGWTPNSSPSRHVAALNLGDKKGRKDSAWTKYFDHGAGKVTAVEAADEHMVDLSQLFLGHRFAYGAHSKLYHGIYKDEAVAVKIITAPDDDENETLKARLEKQFSREVTSLCRLHHPNVIKFVAACRKPPVFCIVTEYLSEGSLRSYLHKLQNRSRLPLKKLVAFALDIARGMEYIHSQGVIHRDLKPENVLINEAFHMKIADFGIACEEVNCDPFADDPGTYRWMAPEMIKDKYYGRKVDVYSFGLILWEMVSGAIPYEDMNPIQAAYAVVNKNLRPPFPKDCPPAMQALIEQCWSSHPDKRPEFWQIVKVLEQFQASLAVDGTLKLIQNVTFEDHKKGLNHWIQKLSTTQSSSIMKPRFS